MTFTLLPSLWSIVVLVTFIGIVLWAYSGKRKAAFDEAARLPFDDDPPGENDQSSSSTTSSRSK
jgi:cytochrome c oxidase cbb3-type subunit 4